ncbi:MAG: EscU/YscU/HrcU family type III secretion system export apparatus switch protein [Bryobacteraceae bacterium]
MSDSAQRTEKPTPRRLERAHKEGQFPVSRDFGAAVLLVGYALAVSTFGQDWFDGLRGLFRELLASAFNTTLTPEGLALLVGRALRRGATSFLLCGFGVAALGVGVQLASTQMRLPGRIKIDLSRLSPMQRIKGLAGQNGAATVYAVALLLVVTWILWVEISEKLPKFLTLVYFPIDRMGVEIRSTVMSLIWRITAITALIGMIDLVRQRAKFLKNLRMTKHEVREEAKDQEGSPQVKMKIRRLQREISKRRMMQAVPTATAVVVNPTHFAVAIRYQVESTGAPLIVAKGKDLLALRIRDLAIRSQVPIVENPPLARALYKSVEVGQEIPGHLYRAVAEILAYIYRLTGGVLPG